MRSASGNKLPLASKYFLSINLRPFVQEGVEPLADIAKRNVSDATRRQPVQDLAGRVGVSVSAFNVGAGVGEQRAEQGVRFAGGRHVDGISNYKLKSVHGFLTGDV